MWIACALLCGFLVSVTDLLCKKLLRETSEYEVAILRWGGAVLFLLPLLFFIEIPELGPGFFRLLLILVPLDLLAIILYLKAIRLSPLGLTIPFLSFTPIFLLGVGNLILGERPTPFGLAGVVLVGAGGYVLNLHDIREGLLAPIASIRKEKGSCLMLAVAFIYSITSSVGKLALLASSTSFFSIFYFLVLLPPLIAVALINGRGKLRIGPILRSRLALPIGLVSAAGILFHFIALFQANVAYAISLKRMGMVFSVLLGAVFLGEQRTAQRLAGSLIMFAGCLVIAFLG